VQQVSRIRQDQRRLGLELFHEFESSWVQPSRLATGEFDCAVPFKQLFAFLVIVVTAYPTRSRNFWDRRDLSRRQIRSGQIVLWLAWLLVIAPIQAAVGVAHADDPGTNAASLHAKYDALRDRLSHNQFQSPLYLNSNESADRLEGELYGVIKYPFATTGPALKGTTHWCDILILHLNVKDCRVPARGAESSLTVYIGSKYDQPAEAASHVDYAYRVAADTPDYLQIMLSAKAGPFGTKDYHIQLEAIPLEGEQTFVHLTYSYAYGLVARIAMEGYLQTVGRAKVGFTITGRQPDGQPIYVAGVRGVVERNAMRYYLAVVAYLGALSVRPQEQFERRLRDWFAFTERYPFQLHEMEQGEYLSMKHREYRRP